MNIIAVTPVFGRTPILKYTIQRLLKKNGCSHVICVGHQETDRKCVEENGGIWVQHENILGGKWNAGFQAARELKPDGVLFVGSSDWVSDNWLDMAPMLEKEDLIGKPDFYMLDMGDTRRMCHWAGYQCHRKGEPIGIGRMVSASILDKMNWKPFIDTANKSMDWQMYIKALSLGGTVHSETGNQYLSLSFSTNRWPNLHKFEDHWNGTLPSRILNAEEIMMFEKEFPEINNIVLPPVPKEPELLQGALRTPAHKQNRGRR